jgi:hypothetical protein
MRDESFLVVAFAFLLGCLFGYMVATPHERRPVRPAYETTTIQNVLPPMGQ